MVEKKGWIPIKKPTDAIMAVSRIANLAVFTYISADGIQGLLQRIPVDLKSWSIFGGITLAGTLCSYMATIYPEKGRNFLLNSTKIFSRGHSNNKRNWV